MKKRKSKKNEKGKKLNGMNYEETKRNLIKRLCIFLGVTVLITIVLNVTDIVNSFFLRLFMGMLFGSLVYIPELLHDHLQLGIFRTIVIGVLYAVLLSFLMDKIGYIRYINYIAFVLLLILIGDMGYSIYKIFKMRKNGGGEK